MKATRLFLLGTLSVLLAGCALMRPPSAKQTRNLEQRARAAEENRAADERKKLMDDQATKQRQRP